MRVPGAIINTLCLVAIVFGPERPKALSKMHAFLILKKENGISFSKNIGYFQVKNDYVALNAFEHLSLIITC